MSLAFELPQHLPRGGQPQDKSTTILTKVGETSSQSLNAHLAASWLAELDSTIQTTKSHISKRIQNDLPAFERQLESSMTVQTRLNDLSSNVDRLADSLNDSKTGLLPNLLRTLSSHGTLAEAASDANITHGALAHLFRIKEELNALSVSVQHGELPESAEACGRIQTLVAEAPKPLDRAEIMNEIRKKYRTLNDRVQEQIGDAYSRSIVFSGTMDSMSLTITAFTTVPPTSTEIILPAVLQSLTSDALSTRLAMLRRDIMSKFVEPVLLSARSITSSTSEGSSTLTLASPSPSSSPSPLQSLEILRTFLNSHIFPYLPPANAAFPNTFHSPITTAILTKLLKPSIPSSLTSLPSFLITVDQAVQFEETLLPPGARDRPIQHWADDVASHYEKKRRETVMQHARQVIGNREDSNSVRVKVVFKQPQASPLQSSEGPADADGSGWDFDGETAEGEESDLSGSWTNGASYTPSENHGEGSPVGDDPSDGWGWGDDAVEDVNVKVPNSPPPPEPPTQTSPLDDEEDDAWGDGWDTQPTPAPQPRPEPEVPKRTPKLAKRLEKFSAKAKGISASNTPVASPIVATTPKSTPAPSQAKAAPRHRPAPLKAKKTKKVEQEKHLVSVRAKTTLKIAEDLMREGQELMDSTILSGHLSSKNTKPGQLLAAAAPLVLDLHRALYPVVHSALLARDQDKAMLWANDCRFFSDEVADLQTKGRLVFAEEKWAETGERLKLLGETWFEDVVARQQDMIKNILVGTQGFREVGNERFEECKSAVEQVLHDITSVAGQWKNTLARSAYLNAMGQIVDDALFRVMDDILSLSDIPEKDSERLSEICEMLAPLEEIFTDNQSEQSVVGSHVPLWFKFSYLSWLIKGSIADMSYLFDQGMLVDYEIDELVRLLRALFAETPLRETTIAKISKGHPVPTGHDDFSN